MTLEEGLLWIIGGGWAALTYLAMEYIPALRNIADPALKRVVSFAIPVALVAATFGAEVGMGYVAPPGDARGWVETVFALISTMLPQLIHGATKLRKVPGPA